MKIKSPVLPGTIRTKRPLVAATLVAAVAWLHAGLPAAENWVNLFDGAGLPQWRSAKSEHFPEKGWSMNDGVLTVRATNGAESADGGDIITRKRYADFELELEFKITPRANGGIKIFVQPGVSPITSTGEKAAVGSAIGLEYQVLDDERHPDAKQGHDGDRTVGSLYDLMAAPKDKKVMPVGEWNQVRIVSIGRKVEFWLNGKQTVQFERGSEDYRRRVARSKYRNIPEFGEWADGHILLQDHGNEVSYRNARVRELK
jgi:hypothetical protein